MKRKLIAFDIDGTLINSDGEILSSTLEVIEKLKAEGHFVTIATGRSLASAKDIIADVPFAHYILCNGAYAFIDHQQVYSNPLDKAEFKQLVALANDHQIDLLYQTQDQVKQQGPFIHASNQEMQDKFTTDIPSYDFDIDREEAIYQGIVFCNRKEQQLFENQFSTIRFTRWNEHAVDAIPLDGSKAQTLAEIAGKEKFKPEDIIVFGDGENDIEMLQYAGVGVVMANASDLVKSHGSMITKSNDDHGIWHAAKELGLI